VLLINGQDVVVLTVVELTPVEQQAEEERERHSDEFPVIVDFPDLLNWMDCGFAVA
jgi:hypothetical protein